MFIPFIFELLIYHLSLIILYKILSPDSSVFLCVYARVSLKIFLLLSSICVEDFEGSIIYLLSVNFHSVLMYLSLDIYVFHFSHITLIHVVFYLVAS